MNRYSFEYVIQCSLVMQLCQFCPQPQQGSQRKSFLPMGMWRCAKRLEWMSPTRGTRGCQKLIIKLFELKCCRAYQLAYLYFNIGNHWYSYFTKICGNKKALIVFQGLCSPGRNRTYIVRIGISNTIHCTTEPVNAIL